RGLCIFLYRQHSVRADAVAVGRRLAVVVGSQVFLNLRFTERRRHVLQCNFQHLVYPLHRTYLEIPLDVLRNLLEVTFIFVGNQHRLDTTTMRRQQFFLQATNRQHLATQGDLAGHGDGRAHRDTGQHRHQGRAHGDTGTRAILRRGTFRDVNVEVIALQRTPANAERARTTLDHGPSRLDRLLHDIAKRTGAGDTTLARYGHAFNGQQLTT